jgi:agmatinase
MGAQDNFDPDAASPPGSGIFGLPDDPRHAHVHIIPVPFDATTSYRNGAARGPDAILQASRQVELFDLAFGRPYERGIAMLAADPRIARLNAEASEKTERIIEVAGVIGDDSFLTRDLMRVNAIGDEVNRIVYVETSAALEAQKLPAVLGGDHSISFGAIQAVSERFPRLGILHFDAHADLRAAYEGFQWSHASIMHNVVERLDGVSKLVSVGLRDVGEREHALIQESNGRVHALFDHDWQRAKLDGTDLRELVAKTIARLPRDVYVSFDIDCLDPTLCPNTGTPVPGGLLWHEVMMWLEELAQSRRRIVALDLNEVCPGDTDPEVDSWDAIVGARLLYRLIGTALAADA